MERLDKIFKQVIPRKTYGEAARSAEICFIADGWGKCRMKTVSYSKGLLKVSVRSSVAASELHMLQGELMDFVNEKIGRRIVRSIRIVNVG